MSVNPYCAVGDYKKSHSATSTESGQPSLGIHSIWVGSKLFAAQHNDPNVPKTDKGLVYIQRRTSPFFKCSCEIIAHQTYLCLGDS